jgi:hypothetical protein
MRVLVSSMAPSVPSRTKFRVFSWEAIYDNARSASHIVPFKQLFHQLMRFGHPSGRHERECQEALTVGRRVQPARRPRQGKRIAWTITGTQRGTCRLTQLPGLGCHAHERRHIAAAARASRDAPPWCPTGGTMECLAHPSST